MYKCKLFFSCIRSMLSDADTVLLTKVSDRLSQIVPLQIFLHHVSEREWIDDLTSED